MSVLVEGTTIVIRRQGLWAAYPGGAKAFLQAVRTLPHPPRFACAADPHFINVAFDEQHHAMAAAALMEAHDMVEDDESGATDFVRVDERSGPLAPCNWLTWERFTNGVTVAWGEGQPPGPLAAPEGWSPASVSGHKGDADVDLSSVRFLPLGGDGPEIVLDLATGEQLERPPHAKMFEPEAPEDAAPLHAEVLAVLTAASVPTYFIDPPEIMTDLMGKTALYACNFHVFEKFSLVVCYTRSPLFIPKPAVKKTMEFITRVNDRLRIGSFELDLTEGALVFRASNIVEIGAVTERMLMRLGYSGPWSFDRYLPKLLEVIYGKKGVAAAVAEAQA